MIELEDVQFTGNSAYDDNGRFYVNNPSPIDYKGATPEADDAWRNLTLTGGMYSFSFFWCQNNQEKQRSVSQSPGEGKSNDVTLCAPTNMGFNIRTRLPHFGTRSQGALAQRLQDPLSSFKEGLCNRT